MQAFVYVGFELTDSGTKEQCPSHLDFICMLQTMSLTFANTILAQIISVNPKCTDYKTSATENNKHFQHGIYGRV